jgi:hypothetical protein
MTVQDNDSIPTRQSLLARLKDWEDQESWREFFDTYWRLIHATALKAGLSEPEAQEVVQGLSARETARSLDTNAAAVHLAKQRVGKLVRSELERLSEESVKQDLRPSGRRQRS